MAAMSIDHADLLGRAIVEYATTGRYLDADLSLPVERAVICEAYKTIAANKSEAEHEIRGISRNYSEHVDVWIKHADSLRKDIDQSKRLGTAIVQMSEKTAEIERNFEDARVHAEFLRKEMNYNDLLLTSLKDIKVIKDDIDHAERKANEKETMMAIRLLSEALRGIHSIPNYHRVRAYTLLEQRALRLETALLEDLGSQWQQLVKCDVQAQEVSITEKSQDLRVTLRKTLAALTHLDQLNRKAKEFEEQIQSAIFQPILQNQSRHSSLRIKVERGILKTSLENADSTVAQLLSDLEMSFAFLVDHLPEFSAHMSENILPDICSQIRDEWLEPLISVDIDRMSPLTEVIKCVRTFIEHLMLFGWSHTDILGEWIDDCARLWITKRKETDLAFTRSHLAQGLTSKRIIIKQQDTQMVSTPDDSPEDDAWDQGWSDDESVPAVNASTISTEKTTTSHTEGPEEGDAWGWNEEEILEDEPLTVPLSTSTSRKSDRRKQEPKTSTVRLKWRYLVSSMPEGVLQILLKTIEDGLSLTGPKYTSNPAATAAMAMFGLPTLILAMYRTASPYYYSTKEAGNMYLYNDALWLAEQLSSVTQAWTSRSDVPPRLTGKVNFAKEVETLEKLGNRAYAKEIAMQRTIIRDMLRGDQCFLSEEGVNIEEDENAIDILAAHVRGISNLWESILARQNWAQAIGALLATIANKIITDVLDISGLEADASYNIAKLIARVVALEDLFTPPTSIEQLEFGGLDMQASEFVGSVWFKLQYLSEILQSNLDSLRFLWFEGEASMFYTASEMIDLIELSFAESSRREDIIRKIRANPRPRPEL